MRAAECWSWFAECGSWVVGRSDWVFLNFFQRYSQISVIYRLNKRAAFWIYSIRAACFVVWKILVCIRLPSDCYGKSKSFCLLTRRGRPETFWENIKKNHRNTQFLIDEWQKTGCRQTRDLPSSGCANHDIAGSSAKRQLRNVFGKFRSMI